MADDIISEADRAARSGDYIVRGTAAYGTVRAFGITARQTVQTARDDHQASPLVTVALGRLLMAGQMMGVMLKGADELITLMIRGDGPIRGLTVTANTSGQAKGYAAVNDAVLPASAPNPLKVGAGIGSGTLTVIRDQPGIEPYTSQVDLTTGEIGDDLTNYFYTSDQVPTSVGLGVLVSPDGTVRQAGGFIVQLMPGYDDETVDCLEANLKQITSITSMLEQGLTPTQILQLVLAGLSYDELDATPVEFHCDCSKERTKRAVAALGANTLREMVEQDQPAEVVCQFCGKRHVLSVDDLKELLDQSQA